MDDCTSDENDDSVTFGLGLGKQGTKATQRAGFEHQSKDKMVGKTGTQWGRQSSGKDLVHLDSDSEGQERARVRKGKGAASNGSNWQQVIIDLNSSDDDDEERVPAKKSASRLPTVLEQGGGSSTVRPDPKEQASRKQAPAPWSPPRPDFSDGLAEPSIGVGRSDYKAEQRKLLKDEKERNNVAWSNGVRGDTDSGDSGDDVGEEFDLINRPKPAQVRVQKRKNVGEAATSGKRQKAPSQDGAAKGPAARNEGSVEDDEEADLEGLDEKDRKKRLAEIRKQQAAREKALKAEERERKREEQRLEKERKKQERQEAKQQAAEERRTLKEQEKQQRASQRQDYQKLSGKDALANCWVQIDRSLIGRDQLGAMLMLELQSKGLKYECVDNPLPHSITWRRVHFCSRVGTQDEFGSQSQSQPMADSQMDSQVDQEEVDVPYVAFVYSAAGFCDMVRTGALWRLLEDASQHHPGWSVCLVIPELAKYIKQRKAEDYKKSGVAGHVAWVDPGMDEALARLCVHYDRVRSYTPSDEGDAAEHIANLTRGHAEAPYKKASTVVGTFGGGNHLKPAERNSLKKWPWLKGLTLMDGVSMNVAEAIKRRYPTLRSLMDAYHDPHTTSQQKAGLLKDLSRTIGLGEGTQPGQESSRRVGPKLSEKIHRFFTASNPDMMIEEISDKG